MYKYNKLTPFKLCVLKSFPFIEADFDALTNYEILCIMKEHINKLNENNNILVKNIDSLNNFFDNLDIQEEVNNKLDEMASSGQLTDIIAQYLNLAGVLAFNTVDELRSAENIVNGSICRTLGTVTYNDGDGAYYKIRPVTSSDIIDNINILRLSVSNTIIAEKIQSIEKQITLFVGDSYANDVNGWVTNYVNIDSTLTMDLNCFNLSHGGAGFTAGTTFLEQITEWAGNRAIVDKIIVCGGWNDRANTSTLEQAINTFMTYAKTHYPNAKVYCGMISNYGAINDTAGNIYWRNVLSTSILPKYQSIINKGGYYLNGVENVLHNYSLIGNDDIHPTVEGYSELGYAIHQAVGTGKYSLNILNPYVYAQINSANVTLSSQINSSTNCIFEIRCIDGELQLLPQGNIKTNNLNSLYLSLTINIGTYTKDKFPYLRYVNTFSGFTMPVRLKYGNNYKMAVGNLVFKRDGTISLIITLDSDITNITEVTFLDIARGNILYN